MLVIILLGNHFQMLRDRPIILLRNISGDSYSLSNGTIIIFLPFYIQSIDNASFALDYVLLDLIYSFEDEVGEM